MILQPTHFHCHLLQSRFRDLKQLFPKINFILTKAHLHYGDYRSKLARFTELKKISFEKIPGLERFTP
jgi:hypothetical protein